MPVLDGAESFVHDTNSDTAVLLCHGFTGTPASMRAWGEALAAEGFGVRCPRLPGHGTSWQEMNRTSWPDWYGCVRHELSALLSTHRSVYVFGLSMGGTLTLRLAQEFGPAIEGIALVNPSVMSSDRVVRLLPLISRVVPSVRGLGGDIARPDATEQSYPRVPLRAAASLTRLWKLVRADLGRVTQPLLLAHSVVDHVVEPVNSRIVATNVRSEPIVDVTLLNSFHVATLDYDAELVFRRSTEFINNVQASSIRTGQAGQR